MSLLTSLLVLGSNCLLHRGTVINIRGESFRLKEKRQAARSALNTLVEVATPSPALAAKEETPMT